MDQDEETDFDQICQDSVWCQNDLCEYKHPRKFQGVCIKFLRELKNFQGHEKDRPNSCKSEQCKLYHFDEQRMDFYLSFPTINGFYCFNFCQTQCQDEICQFVHKSWIEEFCVKNFVNKCKKNNIEQEKKKHINWSQLEKQLQNSYLVQGCSLQQLFENLLKRQAFQDYCFDYFIGDCPNKQNQCDKKHTDWDDLFNLEKQKQLIEACTSKVFKVDLQNLNPNDISVARLICQEQQLKKFQNSLNESNVIDIIFVMDLTGSMEKWKQQMELHIRTVITQFTKDINNHIVRVGLIGYRDICDSKEDQLVYRNLTQNIDEIINFISKLEVKGGGDAAEDVVKGLQQILNLNISRNQESMLCIFLIADSPCHGKQYHDMNFEGADDQLEKVQGTPLDDVMRAIKNLKPKNFFFCIKITEYTNKMFQVMQQIMKDLLVVTPQTKPEQLAETILFTLKQSYTKSQVLKKSNNKFWIQASYQKPKIESLGQLGNIKDAQLFWYNYQNYIKTRCRKDETCLEIELSDEKSQKDLSITQTQSNKTIIFNAFDAINNQDVVLKIDKQYLLEYEQKGYVDEKQISQVEEEAKIRYYAQGYACQIAEIYREKTKKSPNKEEFPPIFYAVPILYKLKQPFKGLKQIYGESLIQNGFQKYSTHQMSISKDYYYYTVFSHFSYQLSNELFVITDLQGSYSIFTDPSFQINQKKLKECANHAFNELNEQFILQNDATNLREKGILFFLNNHKQCSNLCKLLELKPLDTNGAYNNTQYYPSNTEQLQIICDECNSFADIPLRDYYQSVNQTLCYKCQKETSDNNQAVCKCCGEIYYYSSNMQLRSQSIIGICLECKRFNCNGEKKCFYCQKCCSKFPLESKKVENVEIVICSKGRNYLESLKCQVCQKSYNYQKLILKQDYEKGIFICCKQ